jgi:hypothetical protein
MKKHVLTWTAALLGGTLSLLAQPAIPNGDLESWTTIVNGDEPTGGYLKSLNQILAFPGGPPVTCFKETANPHGGTAAAKIVSASFASFGIFIPGALGTITPIANPVSAQLAEPFTGKPESIRAWIKYAPVTGDSAEVFGYLFKTTGGVRETLAVASQMLLQPVSSWTEITVPFTYLNATATPDSASLLFVSSAGYNFSNLFLCQGSAGSALWIDDVSYIYPASITESGKETDKLTVFPNPAEDMVTLTFASEINEGMVSVADMNGREVLKTTFTGTQQNIPVSGLKAGNYVISLSHEKGLLARKTFIKK